MEPFDVRKGNILTADLGNEHEVQAVQARRAMEADIKTYGAIEMMRRVKFSDETFRAVIVDGVPPSPWTTASVPGAVVFFIDDGEGKPVNRTLILCVNAPNSKRDYWESVANDEAGEMASAVVIMDAFRPFLSPEEGGYPVDKAGTDDRST